MGKRVGWRVGAVGVGLLAAFATAQGTKRAATTKLPAFSVVSVQPFQPKGPWHRLPEYDPQRLYIEGMYLVGLIHEAYQVNYNQIVGLRRAMRRSMTKKGALGGIYRVIGTTDEPTSQAQMRLMLRRVLAERFQMVVEDTDRVQPVYDLVVARGGPKLRASKSDGDCSKGFITSEQYDALHLPRDSRLIFRGCTIGDLVGRLNQRGWAGVPHNLPVIDKTGLQGQYAMALWLGTGGMKPVPGYPGAFRYIDVEPLQDALKRELGLELVKSTGPYRELVIEHIAEPSPN